MSNAEGSSDEAEPSGTAPESGGDRTRLRHQIDRLFSAHVELIHETPGRKISASSHITDYREFWWDYKRPEQDTLWQSRIRLGEAFFNEIGEGATAAFMEKALPPIWRCQQ